MKKLVSYLILVSAGARRIHCSLVLILPLFEGLFRISDNWRHVSHTIFVQGLLHSTVFLTPADLLYSFTPADPQPCTSDLLLEENISATASHPI